MIDILAFHPGRRALLVIEIKTDIVDVQDLVGSVDRKRRLASRIARERGWGEAVSTSVWVVVEDARANRRCVDAHRSMLRRAFPDDGRTVRGWLRSPDRPIAALSFVPISRPGTANAEPARPPAGPAAFAQRGIRTEDCLALAIARFGGLTGRGASA